MAFQPPYNAVMPPTIAIISDVPGVRMNGTLKIRKTPAATIVAACINADTGVGPSIASGSQVDRGNCADLPITPAKMQRPPTVDQGISTIRVMSKPATAYVMANPTTNKASPTRLNMNAFVAAAAAAGLSRQ